MDNLEGAVEITNLNFEGDNPHLAVCHKSQGYSANKRTQELVRKSNIDVSIIKSLKGVDEAVIQKMMFNNKRNLLEEAIAEKLKESGAEYPWVYIQDMNEDMVIFDYDSKLYAVTYTETEDSIEIGTDPVMVNRADVYKDSESGEVLVKSSDWLSGNSPELKDDGESKEGDSLIETPEDDKEEIMSDVEKVEVEAEVEEVLMKASEVTAQIQKAVELALANKDAEIIKAVAKAKLETDTTELVKGFGFIEEGSVEELVKCLVDNTDFGAVIFKALDAAKVEVTKAKEELVKVKEEFGKPEAIEGEVKEKNITKSEGKGEARTQELAELVKAKLANK